jgi:phosphatidylinositol alpha-1,6-mannosyltransferase
MERRPRVALVTSGLGPRFGGIGVVCRAVADAFAADADITIWRHHPDWPAYIRSVAFMLRASAGLLHPPDFLLFAHVDLARVMPLLPFTHYLPYGVLIHGVEVWRPLDRVRKASLTSASAILAFSEYTVKKAREANPWLPDVHVVWLGAAERKTPERIGTTSTVLVLGRMASSERYKGHDSVIDAWPRILAAVPTARLVIAGGGDDRERLEHKAAGTPSIRFTGFLTDEERDRLLASSTVLVSISTGEGFGLAAVEAASSGLPVVALKGTVTDELFPNGCGHVLLDSAEPQPLAEALVGLLSDAGRARAIGAAGLRRVQEAFTLDQFRQRLRAAVPLFSSAR